MGLEPLRYYVPDGIRNTKPEAVLNRPPIDAEHLGCCCRPESVSAISKQAVNRLKLMDFDAIVVQGMSGAIIGSVVAHMLSKHIVVVRKPGEDHHGSNQVVGLEGAYKYLILDDMISSGTTVLRIVDSMTHYRHKAKLVGMYLYKEADPFQSDWEESNRDNFRRIQMLDVRIMTDVPAIAYQR